MIEKNITKVLIQEPEEEPVSVADLAFNLRLSVDPDVYDGIEAQLLARLISSAREDAENYMQRDILARKWQVETNRVLPVTPLSINVKSIESVIYTRSDDTETTLAADEYKIVKGLYYDTLMIIKELSVEQQNATKLTILFNSGLAETPDQVKPTIKQAIILLASHWYQNREATSPLNIKQVPLSYRWLLPSPPAIV